ncbi:unnamed protein product, partial [Oikopleura dioica]
KNTLSGYLLSADQRNGYHVRLFEGESEKHFHSEVLVLRFQITKNDMKEKLETGQSQIAALFYSQHTPRITLGRED